MYLKRLKKNLFSGSNYSEANVTNLKINEATLVAVKGVEHFPQTRLAQEEISPQPKSTEKFKGGSEVRDSEDTNVR